MAELQQGLFVVKTEERYDPSFSYRWDLVEAWLPDAVREGRRLGRPRRGSPPRRPLSRRRRLGIGARASPASSGCRRDEVRAAVAAMTRAGEVSTAGSIPGLPADDSVVHRTVRPQRS